MPNRVIKDSIKSSVQIDSLTWFEEVVFYRLMVSADDYGCYDGRPIYLKNALFPTKDNVTRKAIEDAIQRLVSAGLLIKYEVNGMPYLFFPTWEKHQRIRNKKRKYPAPPDDVLLTASCCQMTATCHSESESELESESNPKAESESAREAGLLDRDKNNPFGWSDEKMRQVILSYKQHGYALSGFMVEYEREHGPVEEASDGRNDT